ncbi:MAG: LysM peptidoglycan-binding domain-containing protein [Nitrospirota bacterium]
MCKKILIISFALFFLLPCFIVAQTQEYREYTVNKGDTLWEITQEELKNPFLWPKVWKENPQIENPDRIFPNQKIKIPLHFMQEIIEPQPEKKVEKKPVKEIEKPAERIIQPVRKEYLVDRNLLIASGYIADSVHSVGKIVDSEKGISMLSKGDLGYVKVANPAKKGDKFYITRSVEKVNHPVSGNKIGYLIQILGTAEIVDPVDEKILITDSFLEIPVGSLLDTFCEITPPLAIDNPKKPNISGYVIATREQHVVNGTWDIVYLDKGKNDGIQVGDLLAVAQHGHEITMGLIQVISTKESTSTAIVRKARSEIMRGDSVIGAMQE